MGVTLDDGWTDRQIVEALGVGRATSERTRKRYVQEGMSIALNGKKSERVYDRKMDGAAEAHLIALATSEAPDGRDRWTVRLLATELVRLEKVPFDSISHESIRQALKKTNLSLGKTKNG